MALHTPDPVDGGLFKFILKNADNKQNKPIIQAVEAFTGKANGPVDANAVRQVAVSAARDQLKLEGVKNPSTDLVNERAYESTTVAAVQQPFVLKQDTRSAAKSVHYFASGTIAAKVSSHLEFLPSGIRHFIGFHVANVVGIVKEIADQIKGTGFNTHDIATDNAGAKSALKN